MSRLTAMSPDGSSSKLKLFLVIQFYFSVISSKTTNMKMLVISALYRKKTNQSS